MSALGTSLLALLLSATDPLDAAAPVRIDPGAATAPFARAAAAGRAGSGPTTDSLALQAISSNERMAFPPPPPPGRTRIEGLPPDADAELLAGSEEWVFAADGLMVARGRLRLSLPARDDRSAALLVAGRHVPLVRRGDRLEQVTLVPLLGGARPGLELVIREGGTEARHALSLRVPRSPTALVLEPDCVRARLSLVEATGDGGPLSARCAIVRAGGQFQRRRELELRLAWDAAADGLSVDGVQVRAESPGVFALRVTGPGAVLALRAADGSTATLRVELPPEASDGSLGVGIGPYVSQFREGDERQGGPAALMTIYAAYRVSDTARVVFFGANDLSERVSGDYGLYFSYETLRLLDDRIKVILLPGVHGLGMRELDGDFHTRLSFPQGFELKWEGPFPAGHYAALGGFVDPYIVRTGYTNLWLRYGPPDLFAEINVLGWETELDDGTSVSWIAAGLSVGMKLFDLP